jgi:protein-S-isoprenylcysteine O-methyltransferase Ste14
MKQRIKINGVVIIIGIAVIIFFPHMIIRDSLNSSDGFLEVAGLSLILLGQLLRVSARGHKAENSRSGGHLIQDGPYSMVRNPMYLGIILIGLGTVLFILELWVVLLFAFLFILRYWELFIKEEKILHKAFGAQYASYMKKVPRLIPAAAVILKKDIRDYLPLKLKWFKRELLSVVLVLAACFTFALWEAIKLDNRKLVMAKLFTYLTVAVFYSLFILYLTKRDGKKAG